LLYEDFWLAFLNIWIVWFSILPQLTLMVLPLKRPNDFYMCSGTKPMEQIGKNIDAYDFLYVIGFLSIVFHIFVEVRIQYSQKKENSSKHHMSAELLETNSLMTSSILVAETLLFLISVLVVNYVNTIDYHDANKFPGYAILLFIFTVSPPLDLLALDCVYYLKQKNLRDLVGREIKDMFYR